MTEFFRQLALIATLLGGFAITFLSVLLTAPGSRPIVNWMVGLTTAAATLLMLSAVGSTLAGVVASNLGGPALPPAVERLHNPVYLLFLAGTVLVFLVLGLSGWMRTRSLGVVTSLTSLFGLIGGALIIAAL